MNKFDSSAIIKQSKIYKTPFSLKYPNFFPGEVTLYQLQDTSNLRYESVDSYHYFEPKFGHQLQSSQNEYPSNYRLTGFTLSINPDIEDGIRTRYGFLNWLEDVGGFYGALKVFVDIIILLIHSNSNFTDVFMVSRLFKQHKKGFKQ